LNGLVRRLEVRKLPLLVAAILERTAEVCDFSIAVL